MYIEYGNGQDLKRKGITKKIQEPELKFSMSEEASPGRDAKKPMG